VTPAERQRAYRQRCKDAPLLDLRTVPGLADALTPEFLAEWDEHDSAALVEATREMLTKWVEESRLYVAD
jgi:hypothetical protein